MQRKARRARRPGHINATGPSASTLQGSDASSQPLESGLPYTAAMPSPTSPKAAPDALRNLGPRSREMLAAAGIHTVADLAARGAVRAWDDVRRAGQPASLNLLWALVGALEGRDWREVARHDRLDLLTQIEALSEARKALRD